MLLRNKKNVLESVVYIYIYRFTIKNSLNVTAYLSLQTYFDCFVFTEPASKSSVIFLSFVCEESMHKKPLEFLGTSTGGLC